MLVPMFPEFSEIDFSMRDEIKKTLLPLKDGLSDFFFSNIFFFKDYYSYKISRSDSCLIIKGEYEGKSFAMIPSGKITASLLQTILKEIGELKFISESLINENKEIFSQPEFELVEDRNNFDYLYLREELANLSGKKFHKKRNHVNKFKNTYTGIEIRQLTKENVSDAVDVLDKWLETGNEKGDYDAAKMCLQYIADADITGLVLYVENIPVAWTAAEISGDKNVAVVYFEKADITYDGAFQYINYAFANFLPKQVLYINREQDLGKEGLIRSKQTYNPVGFVKKYTLRFASSN